MVGHLSRWWRIARSGVSFAVFGLAGLLLAVLVFPCMRLLPGDRRQRELSAQKVIHWAFHGFLRFAAGLGLLSVQVKGRDKLAAAGGHLVVANHPTLLDVVMLVSLMPQVDSVVKRDVGSNPFLRGVAAAAGYLSNDLGEALVEACAARLMAGRALLLFPEGTRSPARGLGRFRRGAAHVALRSGAPILPVVITCEPPSLMRHQAWYHVPERPMRFTIEVCDPLDTRAFARPGEPRGAASRRLNAALRDFFAERLQNEDAGGQSRARGVNAVQGRDLQVGRRSPEEGVPVP